MSLGSSSVLGLAGVNSQLIFFLRLLAQAIQKQKHQARAAISFSVGAELWWLMKIAESWCEALPESEVKQREGR